jgi:HEAT repeat protein
MTFEEYLADIAEEGRQVGASKLTRLSGLEGPALDSLRARWDAIGTGRRLSILTQLAEMAEDNVELDFEAVFRHALDDADPRARVAAIEGLWEAEDRRLADRFIDLMRHDPEVEVRAAAAGALGKFVLMGELEELGETHARRVREALIAAWRGADTPDAVRCKAIEALGASSEDPVPQLIEEAYAGEDQKVRISAVFAMGRNMDERWLPSLLHELRSDDPEMRHEAVHACGALEDRRAVPDLIRLLDDRDPLVRVGAIDALGQIGGPQARQTLQRLLTSDNEAIRDAAEEALEALNFSDDPMGSLY